jgi:AcrR family transcriptional regulator
LPAGRVTRADGAKVAADLPAGDRPLRADFRRNRDALLASASKAFAERGVDASLEDIAQHAGVGSATLHRHFPTREALIANVYRGEVEALCTDVADLLDRYPADEALAEWMRRVVNYVMAKRGMAAALKAAICGSAEFNDIRDTIYAAVTRLVEPAIKQGLIRRDAAAGEILRALGGFCLFDDQPDAQTQAVRLVELVVDGLRYGARPGS